MNKIHPVDCFFTALLARPLRGAHPQVSRADRPLACCHCRRQSVDRDRTRESRLPVPVLSARLQSGLRSAAGGGNHRRLEAPRSRRRDADRAAAAPLGARSRAGPPRRQRGHRGRAVRVLARRRVAPRLRYDLAKTVGLGAAGLVGAVIVGVGEETLFRGVLLRRLSADAGGVTGVLLSTALYAVVHALRPGGSRDAYAWAGVERTLALFAPLGNPGVLPSILGLFGFGLLLVFARLRSGGLWLPIGIHAAWVAVFRVGRLVLDIRRTPVLADRSRLAAAGGRGRRMDRDRRHARHRPRRRVARHPVTRPGDRCLRRATIRLPTSRSGSPPMGRRRQCAPGAGPGRRYRPSTRIAGGHSSGYRRSDRPGGRQHAGVGLRWVARRARRARRSARSCSRLRRSRRLPCGRFGWGPASPSMPRWVRMRRTTRGSSIVAMTRIRPEQFGQANASTETTRWGKSAQLNVAPANRRRQRSRVHEHRPRRLGVPPRRRAPLHPTRQARGQRLHRVLQRVVSGRVLERELVRRSR